MTGKRKPRLCAPSRAARARIYIRCIAAGIAVLCGALLFPATVVRAEQAQPPRRFTLVIDAGHGGHDAGAVGSISKEKNINLRVALALGRLVEQYSPDVRVVYTRSTDVFVPLDRRAEIANSAKADLFISIHTNALPGGRIAYGAETYTLGMARAAANLEVAKRENAVITYEKNYQQTYEGFDPNKAESYIIFELMQDRYMAQSVDLARAIQQQYRGCAGRRDKGVHQAGFLVLRKTSMPAVLTELGFISTPDEERYLNSQAGIEAMGRSLYNGFAAYRNRHDRTRSVALQPLAPPADDTPPAGDAPLAPPAQERTTGERDAATADAAPTTAGKTHDEAQQQAATGAGEAPVFKVQLLASDHRLSLTDPRLKGLTAVDYYREGGLYKYTYGATPSYAQATRLRREVLKAFPQAFIIAFVGGERVRDVQAARRQGKP